MDPELTLIAVLVITLQGACAAGLHRIGANVRPIAARIGNGGVGSSGFTEAQAEAIQTSLAEIEAILADAADELPEIFANLGENDGSAPSPAPMFANNSPLLSSIAPLILHKLMGDYGSETGTGREIRQEDYQTQNNQSEGSPEETPQGQGDSTGEDGN